MHEPGKPVRFVASRPQCDEKCTERGPGCHYRVAWSINPHMKVGAVRFDHALRQHDTLVAALAASGAFVELVPFVHGAFDSVFSKDNAILVERGHGTVDALIASPRHPERVVEQLARARALQDTGVFVEAKAEAQLEGGDVVMMPGARGCFLGHGFRSSPQAARDLTRFLDREVVRLELRDPRLYHLDMALSILDDGTAIVCEGALTPESLATLARHPSVTDLVAVPLAEALQFGVNLVQVGDTIVSGASAPTVFAALRSRGYRVRAVDLGQFHLAGGSAACLVSRVHSQAEVATDDYAMPHSTAA